MLKSLLIHPEELSTAWIRRAYENRISLLALHPHGGREATASLSDLLARLQTPEYRELIDYALSLGLSVEYECHAGSYLLDRSLFAEHPDYFRMDQNGDRNPDLNFCVSNPEALALVAENAVTLAKQLYRNTHRYYFWMDDARSGECHCPACRRLSASDKQLTVMNHIVKALRRYDPNASLAYLAYHDTLPAPTTVRPEPGIFLEYAPIDRDQHTPLEASADTVRKQVRPLLALFGRENAKVLEYWYDNSLFSHWKKPPKPFTPDTSVIVSDLPFYASLGFDFISCFACFLGADYEALYGEPDISAFAAAPQ